MRQAKARLHTAQCRAMAVSFRLLRAALHVLLGLSCATVGARGQPPRPQLCNSPGEVTKPIPPLPNQFSVTVEASIPTMSLEISIREYYDGNRGRLELSRYGNFGYVIYDYDMREAFLLPDTSSQPVEECVVRRLASKGELDRSTQRLNYSWIVDNGTVHVRTMADVFSSSYVAVYMGSEVVRGIPCDRWQACFRVNQGMYITDYYFSNDTSWTSAYGEDPVPVQVILNGTDGTREFLGIYTIIGFNAGPDAVPDDVFNVPLGVSCKGRTPGQAIPLLPKFFSTYIESVDEETQTVYVGRVSCAKFAIKGIRKPYTLTLHVWT